MFAASKAIDLLLSSKWAKADKRTDEVMFPTRESVVEFMDTLLRHKFFHRAKTIIVKREVKATKNDTDNEESSKKSKAVDKSPEASKTAKKEKKKVKLDMHDHQVFVDQNEVSSQH